MSDLARKAYEAYSEIIEAGSHLQPEHWEHLDPIARQAWAAAVDAVDRAKQEEHAR